MKKRRLVLVLLVSAGLLVSCSKEKPTGGKSGVQIVPVIDWNTGNSLPESAGVESLRIIITSPDVERAWVRTFSL